MDKKDQYNNPVGDDLNLSHEGQLPPIWDNISQELNAFDEVHSGVDPPAVDDTIEIDSLPDVDEYSIIKDGFQQKFTDKQPPKFMWDQIEQDLESFTVTDAPSDFSAIKAGFEQTYKENKAPNFTWENLAEQMDNPVSKTPKTSDNYSFVKTGFEKKYSAVVVPLFSWKDLAQRMDNEAALADTPDKFSIIKESFEKEYSHRKPATAVLEALNQQLRMGTYWGKLSHYLGTSTFARKVATFTAIGLLIGGGKACLFDNGTATKGSTAESKAIAFSNDQEDLFNKISAAPFRTFGNKNSANNEEEVLSPAFLAKKATMALFEIKEEKENKRSKIEEQETVDGVLPLRTNEQENVLGKNRIDKEEKGSTNENKVTSEVIAKAATTIKGMVDKQLPITNEVSEAGNDLVSVNNEDENVEDDGLKNRLDLFSTSRDLNWLGQDILDVELMDSGMGILIQKHVNDPAIDKMEEDNFSLIRQAQKGKKVRFELGPSIRLGTSLLLGENTFGSFDPQQISSTQLKLTGAAGLIFNYHFSLNDAIVLGTYPYSKVKQSFGDYTADGNYMIKEVDLTFFDFTLGYQRTLIRYNDLGNVPSKIYARLDVGVGYLMKSQTKVDDVLMSGEGWYNKFTVSAGLTLGNTHEVNQFMIDYGITGNIGVNNLVTGSNTSVLEPARLLNVGAFVGLRYIIFPRLEPSKKQRQFDWSPPFYIEEPIF